MNYNLLVNILKKPEQALYNYCLGVLEKSYPKVESYNSYLYAKGEIPILLIAHMDIVHKTAPIDIFYDNKRKVMWSPTGIGGDDRCGVYSILDIISKGYRPHVLLTMGEEKGGIGAIDFTLDHPVCIDDVNFLIELDRRGYNDAVFYECGNYPFIKYIESFGFVETFGTFSDISIISPEWDIASVNLSVGYFNEHYTNEYIWLDAMQNTINKTINIISSENIGAFDYQPIRTLYKYTTPAKHSFESYLGSSRFS